MVFLCFLPAFTVLISFLLLGADFLASLGILKVEGVLLSYFAAMPISLAFVLMWQHFALGIAFPPMSEAFVHLPNVAKRRGQFGLVGALFAILALLMYHSYESETIATAVSIGMIVASFYGFVVVFEIGQHMAKDERIWHPFKRELG